MPSVKQKSSLAILERLLHFMKTWVRKTLSVGILAAGALLLAPGAAHADTAQTTSSNRGIFQGTQLVAPISVPLNVVGNVAVQAGRHAAPESSDDHLPIWAPVNVGGSIELGLGAGDGKTP